MHLFTPYKAINTKAINLICVALLALFTSSNSIAEVDPKVYEEALTTYHNGDYKTSIIHLKNILAEDSSHLASRVLMAENLLAQGNGMAAEIELNIAKKEGAALKLLAPLYAKAYLMQNKFDRVLSLQSEISTGARYQNKMTTFYGLAYLGKNDLKKASVAFDKVLAVNPSSVDAILGKAKVALKNEKLVDAQKIINDVLTLSPDNKQALLMAAITQKQLNNNEAAFDYINHLLELSPNNYAAVLVRAVLLMDLNNHDAALADIEKIMSVMPNEPIANYIKLISAQSSNKLDLIQPTQIHLESVLGAISEDMMDEQPVYYFLKGLISFQAGAMESAEGAFSKYHKVFPNDTRVLKLLARAELALNNVYAARKYLIKAQLVDENDRETWSLLGRVNLMTGNIAESEFYLKKVVAAYPNSLSSNIDLAKLWLMKGDNEKSIQLLSEILGSDSTVINDGSENLNFELLVLLAKAYQQNKMPAEGLNITKVLIKNYPNVSNVNLMHATLLGLTGDLAQAKRFLELAIAQDESNDQAIIHLARVEAYEGNTQKAISRLKHQLLKGKSSVLMIELGDMYHFIKEDKEAVAWYQKALSNNQGSLVALNKIVKHFEINNKHQEALKVVNQYLDTFNDNGEVHLLAANLYIQARENKKAVTEMNLAVKYARNKAPTLLQQAKMQLYFGEKDKAENSLKYAISVDDSFVEAYELLINLYKEVSELDEAKVLLSKLEKQSFPKYIVNRFKGDLYSTSEPKKSLSYYKASYELEANKPALIGLYRYYLSQKKYERVKSLLERWLEKNPNDLELTLALGENYKDRGDFKNGIAFYEKHILNNPENVPLLNNAAMNSYHAKYFDKALSLSQRALVLAPKSVNVIDTNAIIELALGNKDKALALLREANTLDYGNAEVKYHLALTLDSMNRRKEALKYLEESVESPQVFSEKDKAQLLLKEWQQ